MHIPLAGALSTSRWSDPDWRRRSPSTRLLLAGAERTLGNPSFRERAPAAVVAKEEAKHDEFVAALTGLLRRRLAELG